MKATIGGWELHLGDDGEILLAAWTEGPTKVMVSPRGAKVLAIDHDGRSLLKPPQSPLDHHGGVPVMYPTPNRVRGATFRFDGRQFSFPANHGAHHIHGLVRDAPFRVVEVSGPLGSLELELRFEPGTPWYSAFPIHHHLNLEIRVDHGLVEWRYRVVNLDHRPLPFGFGLHPWFLRLGDPAATSLHVPARYRMEAGPDRLPTGRALPVEGTDLDFRASRTLAGLAVDDVLSGLESPLDPDSGQRLAAVMAHDSAGLAVELEATDDFGFVVVYTPEGQPHFCVENQTCSTDAHNLAEAGDRHTGLRIVPPHDTADGAVTLTVGEL